MKKSTARNDKDVCDCISGYKHQVISSTVGLTTLNSGDEGVISDTVKLLMTKLLFWTSVALLCVSFVVTIVLVVLCVSRRHRPATRRQLVGRQVVHLTSTSENQPPDPAAADRHNGTRISVTLTYCCRPLFVLIT